MGSLPLSRVGAPRESRLLALLLRLWRSHGNDGFSRSSCESYSNFRMQHLLAGAALLQTPRVRFGSHVPREEVGKVRIFLWAEKSDFPSVKSPVCCCEVLILSAPLICQYWYRKSNFTCHLSGNCISLIYHNGRWICIRNTNFATIM